MNPDQIRRTISRLDPIDRRRAVEAAAELVTAAARRRRATPVRTRAGVRKLVTMPADVWGADLIEDITDEACKRLKIKFRPAAKAVPWTARRRR